MSDKIHILFVDDEANVLSGLRRMLRAFRDKWHMHFACGGAEALELLRNQSIAVVVSDMRMPELDGAQLLASVAQAHPQIVRVILSGQSEHEKILRVVGVAHQFLSKPCDSAYLKETIERVTATQSRLQNKELKQLVTQLGTVPCLPDNYLRLGLALDNRQDGLEPAADIISSDIGLSVKVLQLVSSSFFGTPQPCCTPRQACNLLGWELLMQLYFDSNAFQPMESELVGDHSLSKLTRQSVDLAHATSKTLSPANADQEMATHFNAGLLLDVGAVVLAHHRPNQYGAVLRQAERQGISLCQAERETFSATHYDVGAYLLALWGLHPEIVRAVGDFPTAPAAGNPPSALQSLLAGREGAQQ